jgi:hypothetical protein
MGGEADVPAGQGDQVRRHRLAHAEAPGAVGPAPQLLGAHHRRQASGGAHGRVVGDADAGRVLQRDPAARVDGLALGEQERLLAIAGLLGGQPLQRFRPLGGAVGDLHLAVAGLQLDRQRRAPDLVRDAELVGARLAVQASDGDDGQAVGVQHQRRGRVGTIEAQAGGGAHCAGAEVQVHRQADVPHTHPLGLGMAMGVVRRAAMVPTLAVPLVPPGAGAPAPEPAPAPVPVRQPSASAISRQAQPTQHHR